MSFEVKHKLSPPSTPTHKASSPKDFDDQGNVLYEVEKIVDKKIENGIVYYEVKWKDYDTS